jgi:predicted ATPase with chaperone activity
LQPGTADRAALLERAEHAAHPAPVHDLFSDLFARPSHAGLTTGYGALLGPRATQASLTVAAPAAPPHQPASLVDSGLPLSLVADLVLKLLYVHGTAVGQDIANSVRLVYPVVDEALRFLKDQRLLEVSGGGMVGRVSYRFGLTELGRIRARETFEQCRYVGPAPVPVDQYVAQCRRQGVHGVPCTPETLQRAFQGFVIPPELLSELGPAVCSGRSIFIYGPPGNGKTVVAKGLGRFLNTFGGEIYVPYALLVENSIVTVYDPVVHHTTDDAELVRRGLTPRTTAYAADTGTLVTHDVPVDLRWRRIRRPVVITGGELTLDMLELQYNKVGNFSAAPLHIKANGGVFLIDDFGRQLVSPKDLLNRWIIPLEEHVDYLTLVTGRKFQLPFEQLIIFSTNLNPQELVDDAFLRRIRHKIPISAPTRELFEAIFLGVCQQRGFAPSPASLGYLFSEYYDQGRVIRASDARDLHDIAEAICQYEGCPALWSADLAAEAARRLFQQV